MTQVELIKIPDSIVKEWQAIVDLMANLIEVPVGLITRIVDNGIEVFVSADTSGNPYHKGESDIANTSLYCKEVIKNKDMLLVLNAMCSDDWKNQPEVNLNMISYLGFPIMLPNDCVFGTICVLDIKENNYSQKFVLLIKKLRDLIQGHLETLYINQALGDQNQKLSDYIAEIKILRGILPICANCKKIRNDKGYWEWLEIYIQEHSDATFTHGICPDCTEQLYPGLLEE